MTLASVALFLLSIVIYTRLNTLFVEKALFCSLVFAYILYLMFYEVSDYFTGSGINYAVVYHLKYSFSESGYLDYWKLIIVSIFFALAGAAFAVLLFRGVFQRNGGNHNGRIWKTILLFVILTAFILNPATFNLYSLNASPKFFENTEKEDRSSQSDLFYELYKQPSIRQTGPSKNLVFIYAESMERSFFDQNIFPGLISGLRDIESKSMSFMDIRQVEGVGWTMGGIVASQCGIPLLYAPANSSLMSKMKDFLPLAHGLGDLLHQEGYYLSFWGGANPAFGGKGNFFTSKKFDEVCGKDQLQDKIPDRSNINNWGLFDDDLLNLAFQRYLELSETKEKFGLFVLTVDTHAPDGNPSKSCRNIVYQDGFNSYLNAVACSDFLISEFVHRIMESPYYKNTVVVVFSDHLAQGNSASFLLKKTDRKNLFMISSKEISDSATNSKTGSALDIGTTLLPFMGYTGAIGLGRNLCDNLQSESEIRTIHENIPYWRQAIVDFWDLPVIDHNGIQIDIQNKIIHIGKRSVPMPVLIELDNNMKATLKFNYYSRKKLLQNMEGMKESASFLLIDQCRRIEDCYSRFGTAEYCLIAGKGSQLNLQLGLRENLFLSDQEIRRLTGL